MRFQDAAVEKFREFAALVPPPVYSAQKRGNIKDRYGNRLDPTFYLSANPASLGQFTSQATEILFGIFSKNWSRRLSTRDGTITVEELAELTGIKGPQLGAAFINYLEGVFGLKFELARNVRKKKAAIDAQFAEYDKHADEGRGGRAFNFLAESLRSLSPQENVVLIGNGDPRDLEMYLSWLNAPIMTDGTTKISPSPLTSGQQVVYDCVRQQYEIARRASEEIDRLLLTPSIGLAFAVDIVDNDLTGERMKTLLRPCCVESVLLDAITEDRRGVRLNASELSAYRRVRTGQPYERRQSLRAITRG